MAQLRVRCECGKGLLLSAEQAERTGSCPRCGRTVAIPSAAAFRRLVGRERVSIGDLETLAAGKVGEAETAVVVSAGERITGRSPTKSGGNEHRPESPPGGLWKPGETVADLYEVKRSLGEGGFGAVWLVRHTQWNLELAVKELRLDKENQRRRQQFLREANAWVELQMHPHVVTAWYVREVQGKHYLFLEYCDGGSLHDWIDDGRTRDLKMALDIGIQLAWGLAHCHEQEIVHRDFKPLNVLLTQSCTAKITDFGMVKFAALEEGAVGDGEVSAGLRQTMGGRFRGTPPYMPPEQWEANAEPRSDLYALGVTLYEMLTGELPIRPSEENGDAAAWMAAHTRNSPSRLRQQRSDVPESLGALIAACLEKSPASRPAEAMEIADVFCNVYRDVAGEEYSRPKPETIQPPADALNNRAVSLFDLGRSEDAERLLKQALTAEPHHLQATYNWGLSRWRAGKIGDGAFVRRLESVRESHQRDVESTYLLGCAYLERGDLISAIELLSDCRRREPSRSDVARTWATLKKLSEPARCLRTLAAHENGATAVALASDGRSVLSAGKGRIPARGMHPEEEVESHGWTVRLWDSKTTACLGTFEGHDSPITGVTFSPERNQGISGERNGPLRVWQLDTGRQSAFRLPARFRIRDIVGTICLAATYVFATAACVGFFFGIWKFNVETPGEIPWPAIQFLAVSVGIAAVLFGLSLLRTQNADEKPYVSSWTADGGLALWGFGRHGKSYVIELASGRGVARFDDGAPCRQHLCSCLSTDGRVALVVPTPITESRDFDLLRGRSRVIRHAVKDSTVIRLWDVAAARCLRELEGHERVVTAVAFSPDGRYALSGSEDLTLRLWDVATGRCLQTFRGHNSGIASVTFSPDGRQALSAGYDLRLWDVGTGRCVHVFRDHTGPITAVAFSRDGRRAVSGSKDGTVRLWHVPCGESQSWAICRPEASTLLVERNQRAATLTAQARTALQAGDAAAAYAAVREVMSVTGPGCSRELASLQTRIERRGRIIGRSGSADPRAVTMHGTAGKITVAFHFDGRHVLSANDQSELCLWNLRTGKRERTVALAASTGGAVTTAWFSTGGRRLILGDADGSLRLMDVTTGRCLREFRGHGACVSAAAISPDGRWLASGSHDNTLRLWDVRTARCLRICEGHRGPVTAVACAPDGRRILSGSHDKTLRMWKPESGQCLHVLEGHVSDVESVAFCPDGSRIISGSLGGMILWDAISKRLVQTLEGHTATVRSLAFSPAGRWAVSGSTDSTLRLWDIDTGECVETFEGHTAGVRCVAVSPNGRLLLSGSDDHTVRAWDLVWDYEFPDPVDWDDGARPFLENFLTRHTPYAAELPKDREPSEDEIRQALTRRGVPKFTAKDLQQLLHTLGCAGYGWLLPEGVKKKLLEMAANWTGPPALISEDRRSTDA